MRKNMSTRWYVKFPIDAYALGPFEFTRPIGARACRAYVREWAGVKCLPRGTQVWSTK
jgi:hypothetical protein